jgi:hypothetical protein
MYVNICVRVYVYVCVILCVCDSRLICLSLIPDYALQKRLSRRRVAGACCARCWTHTTPITQDTG